MHIRKQKCMESFKKLKKSVEAFTKRSGIYPVFEVLYNLPITIKGLIQYHFRPRKTFVLIVSSMRSGSTLLKALLAEAPDIEQLPETRFQLENNFYATYHKFARLSKLPIIVLKHPSNFTDYRHYPRLPKVPCKIIRLVRNPLETLISVEVMEKKLGHSHTHAELIDYWNTTYKNLLQLQHPQLFSLNYETLIEAPEATTAALFAFCNSSRKTGTRSYSEPRNYQWGWGKDDGGEVIKNKTVTKVAKDLRAHTALRAALLQSPQTQALLVAYQLSIPE